jgi:ubiquinone/menaquinone biosynthesis C-methylase UbiE
LKVTAREQLVGEVSLFKTRPNWEEYYSTLKRTPRRLEKTAQFIADAMPDLKNRNVRKVLDLGCGAGRHCILLAKGGFEVVGMDISKDALKMARRWVLKEKLESVAFVRATMTNVPLSDSCLDAVVSVSVIHHALKKDIVTAVNEIHRILSKNGWVVANLASIKDPRYGTGRMLEKNTFWILEAYEEKHFGELHHFFTRREAFRLLHHFVKIHVTTMKDRPNYWKIMAVK